MWPNLTPQHIESGYQFLLFRLEPLSQNVRRDFLNRLSHLAHCVRVIQACSHSVQTVVYMSTTVCMLYTRPQGSGGEWLQPQFPHQCPMFWAAMGSHPPPDTPVGHDLIRQKMGAGFWSWNPRFFLVFARDKPVCLWSQGSKLDTSSCRPQQWCQQKRGCQDTTDGVCVSNCQS